MAERTASQGATDATPLWKHWQEATSNMWSTILSQNQGNAADPYGLYQLWLKNVGEAQSQVRAISSAILDPKEAWKLWFDTTNSAWKRAAELGADPLGLTTQWLEMLEDSRTSMLAGDPASSSFTFFKQWYDATSETWAKAVGDLFASEQFMEAISHFLESYAGFSKTLRKANEEYFKSLQLPTRSDIARVAELIVAVEEKVDRVEDAFADFQENAGRFASGEAVGAVQGRLEQLENHVKLLPLALEKLQALDGVNRRLEQLEQSARLVPQVFEKAQGIEAQTQRLAHLESSLALLPQVYEKVQAAEALGQRLDHLNNSMALLPQVHEKMQAVDGLAARLDQLERKLDSALAALERVERSEHTPRKTTRKNGDHEPPAQPTESE